MKRWTLIALAILASWLLDRAGWLRPALWGALWLSLALLGLALCSVLLDCVIHSLRPANAPRRPSLFRIVRESIQEVRAGQALENQHQAWDGALASARQAAQAGESTALEALAAQGLGDAWMLLAEHLADPASPGHDDCAATAAYQRAAGCTAWVNNRATYAFTLWEDRVFLGLGATPDYAELRKRWESGHVPGDGRELELAWLHAHGRGGPVDTEQAWFWLALRRARWGERDPVPLPEGDATSLHALLEKRVDQRRRVQLEKQAADWAHAEFVTSR